jgi:20S proteasome subunit beta 6
MTMMIQSSTGSTLTLHLFTVITTLSLLSISTTTIAAQKFDPYQLNGGLVSAVAGKDYVLIASDTRLTDGGYGVHSRRYLSGRLWSVSSWSSTAATSTSTAVVGDSSSLLSAATGGPNVHWDTDGSLLLPTSPPNNNNNNSNNRISTKSASLQQIEAAAAATTTTSSCHYSESTISNNSNHPPILIGSAGCASDCESLKRRIRLELDALQSSSAENYHHGGIRGGLMNVSSVANLLQQILYSRRGFPFYSLCVVAGLHHTLLPTTAELDTVGGGRVTRQEGAVYVYDAIGSYERVAVASAGTGRELLQPILDQLFSSSSSVIARQDDDDGGGVHDNKHPVSGNKLEDEGGVVISSIPPERQRVGVAGSLRPPVPTTVTCSIEDAVKNVARAYQSVAEREIAVGDEVVICVVKASAAAVVSGAAAEEEGAVLRVYRYPLKKH